MNTWELPTSLCVGGGQWKIRADFRAVIDILKYFNDPEYEPDERWEICLTILYEDYGDMPASLKEEAMREAAGFIDMGVKPDSKIKIHTMDWEQDANLIIPAVNRVLGQEIRALPYLHWWTFLGAYMEIGECLFSQVLNIRVKKASGKKLEKWEQEYYRANKELVDLETKYTDAEKAEKQRLLELLG